MLIEPEVYLYAVSVIAFGSVRYYQYSECKKAKETFEYDIGKLIADFFMSLGAVPLLTTLVYGCFKLIHIEPPFEPAQWQIYILIIFIAIIGLIMFISRLIEQPNKKEKVDKK